MKPKKHFLTFVVEDYFHSSALSSVISPRRWQRFERRIEANTRGVMDILDQHQTRATFFVLGCVADEMPALMQEISQRGHEVASKGHCRRPLSEMTPSAFRADVCRSKLAIENATRDQVLGFRLGRGSLHREDLWALDILAEEGFRYDSSVYPQFCSAAKGRLPRFPHVHRRGDRQILELPLSTFGRDDCLLRVAGGNYVRQFPNVWIKQAFRYWHDHYTSPFNMYFHVWEFDADLPQITGVPLLTRMRQYRNLTKVPDLLRYFLENYSFGSIANVMDMKTATAASPLCRSGAVPLDRSESNESPSRNGSRAPAYWSPFRQESALNDRGPRQRVTIVIPCYNERPALRYLQRTLAELDETLGRSFEVSLVFVDDGSTDGTWEELQSLFGDRLNHRLIRHAQNLGVAAATLTGIRHADTPMVCAIDADCTYDPHQLQNLIPLLTDSVDLVTASPYHPLGGVLNVPRWRLFLSRGASRLYRLLLRNKLHTYTSCFRVYRKSVMDGIRVTDGRFLGITEILWKLDQSGSQIVECPAVLEARMLGTSKLKTVRGIIAHLKLIARIAYQRFTAPRSDSRSTPPTDSPFTPYEEPHVSQHDHFTTPHATV
jgi:polysaccharide deacetylase family protein (PEP-CTERM system associated)